MLLTSLIYSVCSGSLGSASFYDVNNPAENDGFTGQFSCQGKTVPIDNIYAAVAASCFEKSVCGKLASLTYKGKTIQVPILDECATCEPNQIDLSTHAWTSLESNQDIGILKLTWSIVGSSTNASSTPITPVASPTPTPRRTRFSGKDESTSGSHNIGSKVFLLYILVSAII